MKPISKITLVVSGVCLVSGIGGVAAPTLRDSLNTAVAAAPREEAVPPITPLSTPEADAPRFRAYRLASIDTAAVQGIALNNNGDVLCLVEDRESSTVPSKKGKRPLVRYRTVRSRYLIYRGGKAVPIASFDGSAFFRPVSFDDQGQVLGFYNDPRATVASNPGDGKKGPNSGLISLGGMPVVRNSRLVRLNSRGLQDLNIAEALERAGMPSRYGSYLESAMVFQNNRQQILIGLQNLYLWENGKARKIGNGGIGTGERIFLNDRGTILRRSDQYRSSSDGNSVYPMLAQFVPGNPRPAHLDFGFTSYVMDMNNRDEILLGRLFAANMDAPRTRFSWWDGKEVRPLFTVNGRTPGRFNANGAVVAWRQVDSAPDWRSIFLTSNGHMATNTPVFWDGRKLYDLDTLVSPGIQIVGLIDFNERNEILVQARIEGHLEAVLLLPESVQRQETRTTVAVPSAPGASVQPSAR